MMMVMMVAVVKATMALVDLDFIFDSINFTAISVFVLVHIKIECVSSCGAEIRLNYRI